MKWIIAISLLCTAHLNAEPKVLAFSGSSREGSFNKELVNNAANLAKKLNAKVTIIDLKDYPIPFYDADLESKNGMPENAKKIRQLMLQSDIIFIASPEYNGSLSGKLKNLIDWASRSEKGEYSQEAFKGKNFVIMSTSPGPTGGANSLAHLRTILTVVGGTVIPEQVAIPNAYNAFESNGTLKNPAQQLELEHLVEKAVKSKQ